MRFEDASLLVSLTFLAALAQIFGFMIGVAPAFAVAAATGIAADWLRRIFDPPSLAAWWSLPLLLLVSNGSGIAALSAWGTKRDWDGGWYLLLPPLTAAISACAARWARQSTDGRCALCNRRLRSGAAFACPRCNLLACEQHCWNFEALRCRLCLENEVPIFAADGRWWDRQFGPRFSHGQCQLCMAEANRADLRTCRHCGRPQCRHCWDMANGRCSRCQWIVEDLPPPLRQLLCGEAAPET